MNSAIIHNPSLLSEGRLKYSKLFFGLLLLLFLTNASNKSSTLLLAPFGSDFK